MSQVRFDGRTVISTGAGGGLGRTYALDIAARGGNVVVNDLGGTFDGKGSSSSMADKVVEEIRQAGGKAVASYDSVATAAGGEAIVQKALDAFGRVDAVINNAGIGAGGSFIRDTREDWERTFGVCWYGVYYGSRVFMPLLLKSTEGHLVNTSSVNGFWASLGPQTAHTAYSAAKFAVKGFTEALVNDCRLNAPHVKVSLVMPGHIGTSIVINTARIMGREPQSLTPEQLDDTRKMIARMGFVVGAVPDDMLRELLQQRAEAFRDQAPMSASDAAKVILDGVRAERWRILVGHDAEVLDKMVRETPEEAYEASFMERFVKAAGWNFGGRS